MLNYGVIGCGAVFEVFQGRSLLRTPGLKLYGVADLNKERLKAVKNKYGFKKATADYRDLLADKKVDVILVNTPQHLHLQPCLDAARAGKHVYVEKPLASNLADAARIVEVCRKKRVKLCVGHQRRFINIEMKARELIARGCLGKVFKIRVIACWYENMKSQKKYWIREFKYGGGPLIRWGIHKTDTLRFLLGQEAVRVYAEMDTFVHKGRGLDVEDNLLALIRFDRGTIAELEVSNSQQEAGMERSETIEVWGDKGTLWYRPSTGEMELFSLKSRNPINRESFVKANLPPDGEEMVRIHRRFIKSILQEGEPPVTGSDGYRALEMVVACYKSGLDKKAVSLPLPRKKLY